MKKIIITASTLLLLGGGITYVVNASTDTIPNVEDNVEVDFQNDIEDAYDHSEYEEYSTLTEVLGAKDSNIQVIKDNENKRTILLTDENGQPQYKSIYIKKKNRLKVVDFSDGLVFNEILGQPVNKESIEEHDSVSTSNIESKTDRSELEEYATLNSHVNVNDFITKVVEDNPSKRVIVLKDNNSKPQYKSIYVKDSNRLKIINLHGGLVYNGIIK